MTVQHHHKEDETLIARSYKGFMDVVKTPPTRTTWLVLVVALLVVVLVGSWFYFTTSATAASSKLWLQMYQTPPVPADLDKFAQDQQGGVQGRFAQLQAADLQMRQAVPLLGSLTDRPAAVAQVVKARDAYEKLIHEAGDTPVLMQQSLIGAAKANETLGDVGKAKQWYQQLAHDYPNTWLGKDAETHAKALDDDNAKQTVQALAAEFAPAK